MEHDCSWLHAFFLNFENICFYQLLLQNASLKVPTANVVKLPTIFFLPKKKQITENFYIILGIWGFWGFENQLFRFKYDHFMAFTKITKT